MNNKAKSNTRLILKTWVRVSLMIALSFLLVISCILIYKGKNPTINENTPKYTYGTNSNIDYKVYLLKNDFYEEKYLGMNKQYTSALIDYIDVDLSYLFTGSLKANMNYTYDVTATIIGEYENTSNGKSELWTKKYSLVDNTKNSINNSTTFLVKQNLKINYNDYNNIVNSFKEKFKIAIDAYLNVKLTVKYDNKLVDNGANVSKTNTMSLNIPLSSTTLKITTDYDKTTSDKLSDDEMVKPNDSMIKAGAGLLITTIVLFLLLAPKLFVSHSSYYLKRLNKIMKSYSEIIVEVTTPLNFENLMLLDIKTFDDMVDIEEEIKSPILYYEIEENKESWFIIVTDKYMYRYILSK